MTDEEFLEKRKTMKEIWKQLIYDEELQNYDISNTGKIRNHETKEEYKLSKTSGMKNCYEFYTITLNNGNKKNIGIHRLLAIMFIPIPRKYINKGYTYKDLVVDHKDDVKYHNIKENLQWLTQKENVRKWYKSVASIQDLTIDDDTIRKICKDLGKGKTIYEVSQKYNVSESLVYDIRFKIRYTDISKDYTFPSKQISEDEVRMICEKLQEGMTSYKISAETGISHSVIIHILCRNSWTQISKDYTFPNTRTNRETVVQICELLQEGKSLKEIEKITGVSKKVAEKIRRGETFTDISKDYVFEYDKCKVPDKIVHDVCKDIASKKYLLKDIAVRNNISYTFVKNLKARKYRNDITSLYEW